MVLININIGPFDIVPDFIGYLILADGIKTLINHTNIKAFQTAYTITTPLTLISLAMIFVKFMNVLPVDSFYTMLSMVIMQLLTVAHVYFIYIGTIEYCEDELMSDCHIMTLKSGCRNYVAINLFVTLIYTFQLNMSIRLQWAVIIFGVILSLIMQLIFMGHISRMKKITGEIDLMISE